MPLLAKNKGGDDFAPVSPGMKQAACYLVADIGTQPSNNPQFKPRRQVVIGWELPGEPRIEILDKKTNKKVMMPRVISQTFTLSLSKKANLTPMLVNWRGCAFTDAELEGFDLQKILGANCLLNIVHATKDGKTYANISSVSPLMPTMQKAKPENPLTFFSLDDQPGTAEIKVPTGLHSWIQAKIMQSDEFLSRAQHPDNCGPITTEEPEAGAPEGNCPF
jgi:hypothetical protein